MNRSENANVRGRQELLDWNDAQPKNAYTEDTHFQAVLEHYTGDGFQTLNENLTVFGSHVAGVMDGLARENNQFENGPKLKRYSAVGERIEQIEHHPTYHEIGRYIYGSGVMSAYAEPANSLGVLSRMYVSSYNGEAGHNCPLACTAGVIRVLQEVAPTELREKYLPRFLDSNYDNRYSGAQFLTEIQGGSDVGANGTRATQESDGTYRVFGEKWFCSNIDANVFLMTARPDGNEDGTRGLGLFLVPRLLEDGTTNAFRVRRLKDKLGTRSMASGECDFDGAVAYHMGDMGDGFRHMMELVINTSRIFNALCVAGMARRAYVTAQTYAQHRAAFGQKIGNYPLVQQTLAGMKSEVDAIVSSSMYTVAMQDKIDAGNASEEEQVFQRFAVNLNKMVTAKSNRWVIVEGIEILGGNGAIESFSVLPRLLRDAIVCENWEGTHNTLVMQLYKDSGRFHAHVGFFDHLASIVRPDGLYSEFLTEKIESARQQAEAILQLDYIAGPVAFRELLDDCGYLLWAVVRQTELAEGRTDVDTFEHFLDLRVRDRFERSPEYFERIARISKRL